MENSFLKFGWKENPFTLNINPLLFTGYKEQIEAAITHINGKHKVAIITGPTGSGKTSLLKWLEKNLENSNKLFISKPPEKPEEFVDIFTDNLGLNFLEKIFKKNPTLFNLPVFINKKLKRNHLAIFLDEAHETNKEVLEWLRVLVDQIENVSLILAGMPVLEQKIRSELETLEQRITSRIYLTSLSEQETRELIKKRIENAGGKDINPFSDTAVRAIYRKTGGFPREIIKMCDKMVYKCLKENINQIDSELMNDFREFEPPRLLEEPAEKTEEPVVTFAPKPPSDNQIKALPYKQRKILESLAKEDWLTPGAIIDKLESHAYKSRGHAIRSINNILHRLMLEGFVQRESRGKSFMYSVSPKVKTLLVEK